MTTFLLDMEMEECRMQTQATEKIKLESCFITWKNKLRHK